MQRISHPFDFASGGSDASYLTARLLQRHQSPAALALRWTGCRKKSLPRRAEFNFANPCRSARITIGIHNAVVQKFGHVLEIALVLLGHSGHLEGVSCLAFPEFSSTRTHIFALANAAKAMAAAEVRFLTSSLHRMCSTCLQMVPVHALRMTPIS